MSQPVGGEGAGGRRGLHRAARLGMMAAVAKAAARGKVRDVLEDLVHTVVASELKLPHAGRIEEQAASG